MEEVREASRSFACSPLNLIPEAEGRFLVTGWPGKAWTGWPKEVSDRWSIWTFPLPYRCPG